MEYEYIRIAKETYKRHYETIMNYLNDGISKEKAYNMVMDNSTLGAGYKHKWKRMWAWYEEI